VEILASRKTVFEATSGEVRLEQRLSTRDSLTRFERQCSRRDELDYYLDAANYLGKRGFNIMTIDNGGVSIEDNAKIVVNKILTFVTDKKS
jgi:hypothetical protein